MGRIGAQATSNEPGIKGREITMYRCEAPWGIVGRATSSSDGSFVIADVLPNEYQFGTAHDDVEFSPVRRDNVRVGILP